MSISVYKHECVDVVRSQKRELDPPELDTDGIYKPPDEGVRLSNLHDEHGRAEMVA